MSIFHKKLFRRFSRLHELGLQGAWRAGVRRCRRQCFIMRWRRKARANTAHHTWQKIAHKHKVQGACADFSAHCITSFAHAIAPQFKNFSAYFPSWFVHQEALFAKADSIVQGTVELFGNHHPVIDWKTYSCPQAWKNSFYADIPITWFTDRNAPRQPDVKIPWDYTRFHHLFVLGAAYQQALTAGNEQRARQYTQTVETHMYDWLKATPYMTGITWKCPMDCAIRVINIIYTMVFFVDEGSQGTLLKSIFCSLYDHYHFLEHNLELSDKPNNHLLADRLGLFFLVTFFKPIPFFAQQIKSKYQAFVDELRQQLLPDGTAYEGSTAYHQLDTEMVLHALMLAKAQGLEISDLEKYFESMMRFLEDCRVTIGDNDSGKIVWGINPSASTSQKPLIVYPNFGLSIIKHHGWHISFRHQVYSAHQPSGHFHQDALSITVSLDGIPFIIDPGSYLYTAHGWSRNQFRSVEHHNAFFLPASHCCNVELDTLDLFQLTLPHNNWHSLNTASHQDDIIELKGRCSYYAHEGVELERSLQFDVIHETLTIEDVIREKNPITSRKTQWMLHLAPSIEIDQEAAVFLKLTDRHSGKNIILENASWWHIISTEVSHDYGSKVQSLALTLIKEEGSETFVFRRA